MIENSDDIINRLVRQQLEAQRALKQSLIDLERNRLHDEETLHKDFMTGRYTDAEYETTKRQMQERYETERLRLLKK